MTEPRFAGGMTPAELETIGRGLYGSGWQTTLAGRLEVASRTVRRWMAGQPIPEGVAAQVLDLVRIAPPASGLDDDARDQACRRALYPHLHELVSRAADRGWEPAEVVTATLAWATQAMIDMAGPGAARETLNAARAEVDADEAGLR